jgi:cyclohexyl-isocyanide hydratase
MNRRDFSKLLGATLATAALGPDALADDLATDRSSRSNAAPSGRRTQVAMLVYPGFTALDLVGPHMVFAMLGNVDVHLVWKRKEILTCEPPLPIQATATFDECPRDLDVLFVPGGTKGTFALMDDEKTLAFLADRGSRARWVTSVCTGSLVLGAAGLLRGYRAGCHWGWRDLLPLLGAEPVAERVVEDRNRITGGGITAGIDLGLTLGARLRGEAFARMEELVMEYDPHPPFRTGSPTLAGTELTAAARDGMAPLHGIAREAALRAQRRLTT